MWRIGPHPPAVVSELTGVSDIAWSVRAWGDGLAVCWRYAAVEQVGTHVLKNAWLGFNCAIFAYGQTGAGKSFTMMGDGTGDKAGLIPRLCGSLFRDLAAKRTESQCRGAGGAPLLVCDCYGCTSASIGSPVSRRL